jgi:hypothetical protein
MSGWNFGARALSSSPAGAWYGGGGGGYPPVVPSHAARSAAQATGSVKAQKSRGLREQEGMRAG